MICSEEITARSVFINACEQVLAEEEKISLDMALKYDEKKETDK